MLLYFSFYIYRFVQAASVIENNLSVFKSASDHVDIVTTIIDYLYSVSVKLMFNSEFDTHNTFL